MQIGVDTGSEEPQWQPCQPANLVNGLRCAVCLDFFKVPHTLICGHTFCMGCLRALAQITRQSGHRRPLDRLRFRCPTCRRYTMGRPFIRRRAAVNFILNELTLEWLKSPYMSDNVNRIKLRTIASQTETENGRSSEMSGAAEVGESSTKLNSTIGHEEDITIGEETTISQEEFREVLFHHVIYKSDIIEDQSKFTQFSNGAESDESQGSTPQPHSDNVAANENENGSTSEDDDSDLEIDAEIVPLIDEVHLDAVDVDQEPRQPGEALVRLLETGVLDRFTRELRMVYRGIRDSRGRSMFTLIWFGYSAAILLLSEDFLPWLIVYTIIFFIFIYMEILRVPNNDD